jgi:hypothetical protein
LMSMGVCGTGAAASRGAASDDWLSFTGMGRV